MVPTAQFFTVCPHARLVRGDDLTCQVAEHGLREMVAPGMIQQLYVLVCTRGSLECAPACAPACDADSSPGTPAGPPPGSPAASPPIGPPTPSVSPGFNPHYRLVDPTAAPRGPDRTANGRLKPAVTPPPRRRRGKPRLQTTMWLEREIGKLPDMHDYEQLYQEWLRRYTAEVGQAPIDTRRSFHNTAAACIRRLLGQ